MLLMLGSQAGEPWPSRNQESWAITRMRYLLPNPFSNEPRDYLYNRLLLATAKNRIYGIKFTVRYIRFGGHSKMAFDIWHR